MKYVPKKLCALITGIDQMIIFEEMCVCGWGGGEEGGSVSTIATDICLTEDWNNNIMCASTAASN